MKDLYLQNSSTKKLTGSLYQEWRIWSKCLGKVVLINGVSSVGKTTLTCKLNTFGFNKVSIDDVYDKILLDHLSAFICYEMNYFRCYGLLKFDDIKKIFFEHKINENNYTKLQLEFIDHLKTCVSEIPKVPDWFQDPERALIRVNDEIFNEVKKFIFSGQNVVIDTLITSDEQLDCISYCFGRYPIFTVLLYSSLEENLKRCFLRNEKSFKENSFDHRSPTNIINQYCTLYNFTSDIVLSSKSKKVNKEEVLICLGQAKNNLLKLLDYTGVKSEKEEISELNSVVKKAFNCMMLYNNVKNVFAVSSVKHDYTLDTETEENPVSILIGEIMD